MPRTVIFTMEGVLTDTLDIAADIWADYFESIGIGATADDLKRRAGFDYGAVLGDRRLFPAGKDDEQRALDYFKKEYRKRLEERNIAMPGIGLVRKLKEAGLKTVLLAPAPEWKIDADLKAAGIDKDVFDEIYPSAKAGGELCVQNPDANDPDGRVAVVATEREAMFLGKNAAKRIIGIGKGLNAASLYESGAFCVFESLAEIRDAEEFIEISEREQDIADYAVCRAKIAQSRAYAVYSGFCVGAAIVTSSGRVYSGCNVENASYGATICAERGALCSAIAGEGKIKVDKLVVYTEASPPAPPCAVCLQVISEFAEPDTEVILVSPDERVEYKFRELLPMPFMMENDYTP